MKTFNREKFLLYMLAGIFIWQAAIFSYGVIGCFQNGGKEACPDLGNRYENTVNVMVATTLALLGAGAVAGVSQKKSSSDRALPSDEQPRQLPRRRSQGKTSAEQAPASDKQVQLEVQAASSSESSELPSPRRSSRKPTDQS